LTETLSLRQYATSKAIVQGGRLNAACLASTAEREGPNSIGPGIRKRRLHFLINLICLCLLLKSISLAQNPEKLSKSTESRKSTQKMFINGFSSIIQTFSEEDGYFFSDNLVSN